MTPERFQQVSALFEAVRSQPPEARAAYLDEHAGGDAELKAAVSDLLRHHDESAGFLQASPSAADPPPETIGPYRIVRTLGEGGMGTVYLAEQTEPIRRQVALKLIKLGMDTREVVARFNAERQVLALMDHPNIARVFDAGATEAGRPYFVMERVHGEPITVFCDRHRLTIRQRLGLFVVVCRALQHAHQKGIIHRDIKPNNILVTDVEGTPTPKLIDFGIAKATGMNLSNHTMHTAAFRIVGTPAYMSPEQAVADERGLDTRTDVYSLGVLLYEMLSGSTPFDVERLRSASLSEMQHILTEEDPVRLSARTASAPSEFAEARRSSPAHWRRALRGDLDWITAKALEKNRGHRYDSAAAFADDVERHLTNQPILAGAPSMAYALRKFVRRNRVAVIAGGFVIAALIGGLTIAVYGMFRAWDAEADARLDAERAQRAQIQERLQREQAEENERKANAVLTLVRNMFAVADPHVVKSRDYTVRELLDEFSQSIWSGLQGQPMIEAPMRTTIGLAYEGLGFFEEAEIHLERAWQLFRGSLGDESPKTARALLDYAWLLGFQGRNDESLELLQRARPVLENAYPDGHKDVVLVRHDIATKLWNLGRAREAEALEKSALEVAQRVLDPHDPTIAQVRSLLAELHDSRGESDDAITIVKQALDALGPAIAPSHPTRIELERDRARFLAHNGDHRAAAELARRVYDAENERFGDCHERTIRAGTTLGAILQAGGRPKQSAEVLEPLWEIARTELPPDSLTRLDLAIQLGLLYARRSDAGRALPLLEDAYEQCTRAGVGPSTIRPCRSALGAALLAAKRYEDALPHLEATLESNIARRGATDRSTLTSLNNIALAQYELGRREKAIATFERILEISERQPGPLSVHGIAALNNIASIHLKQKAPRKAIPYLERGHAAGVKRLGEDNPQTFPSAVNLAEALVRIGEDDRAETLLRTVLGIAKRVMDPTHRTLLVIQNNLARLLAKRGELTEAEPLFHAVAAGRAKRLGLRNRSTQLALMSQAEILRRLGRHEDGLRIAERADAAASETEGSLRYRYQDAMILGALHLGLEQWSSAEAALRTALERLGPDGPKTDIATTKCRLGGALAGQGRFDAAEKLLVGGLESLLARENSNRRAREEARTRVVEFFEKRGDPKAAARWRRK